MKVHIKTKSSDVIFDAITVKIKRKPHTDFWFVDIVTYNSEICYIIDESNKNRLIGAIGNNTLIPIEAM